MQKTFAIWRATAQGSSRRWPEAAPDFSHDARLPETRRRSTLYRFPVVRFPRSRTWGRSWTPSKGPCGRWPDPTSVSRSNPGPARAGLRSIPKSCCGFSSISSPTAVEAMASTPAELRRRPFLRITAQRGGAASFLDPPPSLRPRVGNPVGSRQRAGNRRPSSGPHLRSRILHPRQPWFA